MRSFVIGGLMGIAAGMILMPQVEPETKKRIINKGAGIVEDVSQRLPGMKS